MKQNKIIVAVHQDADKRDKILKRLIIEKGFALTITDASKLIKASINDIDLQNAYFVIADNYKFRTGEITRQTLYKLAILGLAIIIGTTKLPVEFEYMCEVYSE